MCPLPSERHRGKPIFHAKTWAIISDVIIKGPNDGHRSASLFTDMVSQQASKSQSTPLHSPLVTNDHPRSSIAARSNGRRDHYQWAHITGCPQDSHKWTQKASLGQLEVMTTRHGARWLAEATEMHCVIVQGEKRLVGFEVAGVRSSTHLCWVMTSVSVVLTSPSRHHVGGQTVVVNGNMLLSMFKTWKIMKSCIS